MLETINGALGSYASAVFCDDIRHEVGNKASLMGVYNSDLFLLEFPAFVPRLGVFITFNMPVEESISRLRVRVTRGGEMLFEVESPVKDLIQDPSEAHDKLTRKAVAIHLLLPPQTFMGPDMLRAELIVDESVVYMAGKLRISKVPDQPSTG